MANQPVYQQIRSELMRRIRTGSFAPGQQIASEQELAREFHASRTSVRTALVTLEQEGLLERRHGIGTFVTQDPLPVIASFQSLRPIPDFIREQGFTPSVEESEITVGPGPERAYRALCLPPGQDLLRVQRVFSANGARAIYVIDYLPTHWRGQPIVLDRYRDELLKALEFENGILLDRTYACITAANADAEVAAALRLPAGAAVISLTQTGYVREAPVNYGLSYANPALIRYESVRRRVYTSTR